MQKSDSIKELATALCAAQGEIENASKNSNNPHFKSKYADLAEIINTVRPVFTKHGLSLVQMPSFADGICYVETMVMHTSGEWISGIAGAPVSKQDAQGVGSAITYLRRYSEAAMAHIAQEDDDGNAASQPRRDDGKPVPNDAEYAALVKTHADAIIAIRDGIKEGTDESYARAYEVWKDLGEDAQMRLWKAPTKGGCFTTEERKIMTAGTLRAAWFKQQGE